MRNNPFSNLCLFTILTLTLAFATGPVAVHSGPLFDDVVQKLNPAGPPHSRAIGKDGGKSAPLLMAATGSRPAEHVVGQDGSPPEITLRSKDGLKCAYTKEYVCIWSSKDLGVSVDVGIYRPKIPVGYCFLGDVIGLGSDVPKYSTLVIEEQTTGELSGALKKPVSWERVWYSKSEKKTDKPIIGLYRPIPPEGYVAMGLVAVPASKNIDDVPELNFFRCAKRDFVDKGRAGTVTWNNAGGPDDLAPLSLLIVGRRPDDDSGLLPGTFTFARFNSPSYGGNGGGPKSLLPPDDDYCLAGIKGRAGAFIDQVAPVFRRLSDPGVTFTGNNAGGNGGEPFTLMAKKGEVLESISVEYTNVVTRLSARFAPLKSGIPNAGKTYDSKTVGNDRGTGGRIDGQGVLFQGIIVRSGTYVDRIGLIPRPEQAPWVIRGLTPEEIHADVLDGMTRTLIEKMKADRLAEDVGQVLKKRSEEALQHATETKAGEPSSSEGRITLTPHPGGDTLAPGQALRAGQFLRSKSGRYFAMITPRGRLAVYPGPIWTSSNKEIDDAANCRAVMQRDGNLALYQKRTDGKDHFLWGSIPRSRKVQDYHLVLQDDGNLAVYEGKDPEHRPSSSAIWHKGADKTWGNARLDDRNYLDALPEPLRSFTNPLLPARIDAQVKDGTTLPDGPTTDELKAFDSAFEGLIQANRSLDGTLKNVLLEAIRAFGIISPTSAIEQGHLLVKGTMPLRFTGGTTILQPVLLSSSLGAGEVTKNGIELTAALSAPLHNAGGVSGATIEKLNLEGRYHQGQPVLTLKGTLNVGLDRPLAVEGQYSFNDPAGVAIWRSAPCPFSMQSALKVQAHLMSALSGKAGMPLPEPDLPLGAISSQNARVILGGHGDSNLADYNGLQVRGDFKMGTIPLGELACRFNPTRGIYLASYIDRLDIGPLTISGHGPGGGPEFAWECEFAGLTLVRSNCSINGTVDILGSALGFQQKIYAHRHRMEFDGKLGPVLSVRLWSDINTSFIGPLGGFGIGGEVHGLYLNVLQDKLSEYIGKVPGLKNVASVVHNGVVRIDSMAIKGDIMEISKGIIPEMSIHGSIVGQGFTVPVPRIDLKKTPDVTNMLLELLKKELADEIGNFAEEVAKIVKEQVVKYGKEAARIAGESAEKVRKIAEKAAEEAANVAHEISDFSVDAANKVKDFGETVGKGFVSVAKAIANFFRSWF